MSSKYTLFRFIIIVMSMIVSFGLLRSIWEHRGRWNLVENRQQVLEREKQRNAELLEKLRVATSSAFIEQEAREKLGLARPGDTIVLMTQPESSGSGEENVTTGTNLQRWWGLFF